MARLRVNAIGGILDEPLGAVGTTLTSDALEAVPEIVAPDYMPIVLSPDGYIAGPFLAKITAHTEFATTATIEAVDGRTDLPAGLEWVHAVESDDFPVVDRRLLAAVYHNPDPLSAITTTSATPEDVDATNLVVTFTAPASGVVHVELSAMVSVPFSAQNQMGWALRDGSSTVTGSARRVFSGATATGATGSFQASISYVHRAAGLTPGDSYTWKFAQFRVSGSGTVGTVWGADLPPAVMQVFAVEV